MKDVDAKQCSFCKQFKEMILRDEYYINNRDGRTGKTECEYSVALVHEIYYNGSYCGRSTYNTEPLNYCPVCGIKLEADGDLIESTTMKVYILVGRCGTEFNGINCSANLNELQSQMKKAYEETIRDLLCNYSKDESSCGDMEASIVTGDSWYEWVITEHNIEI
jgi:hypothetical protein